LGSEEFGQLGLGLDALLVEFSVPPPDPGPVGVALGGRIFQFSHEVVLASADLVNEVACDVDGPAVLCRLLPRLRDVLGEQEAIDLLVTREVKLVWQQTERHILEHIERHRVLRKIAEPSTHGRYRCATAKAGQR